MTHSYIDVAAVKASYAPYHKFPMFEAGYESYMAGALLVTRS